MGFCTQGLATYQQVPTKLVRKVDKYWEFPVGRKSSSDEPCWLIREERCNSAGALLHSNIWFDRSSSNSARRGMSKVIKLSEK